MNIPRPGEIAAYVAKQCDIPFGDEQKKIARLKEGRDHPDTSNEVAKLRTRVRLRSASAGAIRSLGSSPIISAGS